MKCSLAKRLIEEIFPDSFVESLYLDSSTPRRQELEPEFSGLCVKPGGFLVLSALFLLLKDGGVVWLLGGDHVIDNPGKLMGGSGHGLRSPHAGFHAAEVVSEETDAAV
ncbi:MAG: hypothetical protein ACYCOR_17075 [Acidobacteriaceae bacterium]